MLSKHYKPWNQQFKMFQLIFYFLVVTAKLNMFWFFKSAIALLRASVLTMVERFEEMVAHKRRGDHLSGVIMWWG